MNKATTDDKSLRDDRSTSPVLATKAIVPSAISLGTDIAERSISTSFELLQGARTEIKSVADATINYADTLVKSTLGFTRTFAARVDQLTEVSLDQARSTALDVVNAVRNTGHRAAGFVSGTTGDVVGGAA